jgi:hypothetical protein
MAHYVKISRTCILGQLSKRVIAESCETGLKHFWFHLKAELHSYMYHIYLVMMEHGKSQVCFVCISFICQNK